VLPLALLPGSVALSVDGVALDDSTVTLWLRTTAATACCPLCGQPSQRVHSRYTRQVRDLPYQGRQTVLQLTARKFFCDNAECPRKLFCERLPDLVPRYAHSAARLGDAHRSIGSALGGEEGARLAFRLGMPTSPDTLLRRIKEVVIASPQTPRVLGVDDWAWRKGRSYGTILVDLERRAVIDLLPGRDGTALHQWLTEHPGVEVISRDRAGAYAQAATQAAPQATQVADRWHLLKNVREMLDRSFERHRANIQAASAALAQPLAPREQAPRPPNQEEPKQQQGAQQEAAQEEAAPTTAAGDPACNKVPPRQQPEQAKGQQRLDRYQQARQRHAAGQSIRQIAQEIGLSRNAIRRYLRQDHCPDWRPGQPRRTQLDRYQAWIDAQIQAGRDSAVELHRELTERGFEGSYDAVRRFVTRRLAALGKKRERANAAECRHPPAPSSRSLAFEVVRAPGLRKPEEQARVAILRGINEELGEVLTLAEELAAMLRKQSSTSLPQWLLKAEACANVEMQGFAQGIRQDEAAVSAAITEQWSNGQVEGQVNRLKVIKRQMYGRAGLDLLRARVLHTG
jgi:transposase